jgi:phage baseplate assembly protein W
MPLNRTSRAFKDISMSLLLNPLTRDVVDIKNETAIARSVRNLILTEPGERLFGNQIGSKVSKSLFENIDVTSAAIIKNEIINTIENYEPRVILTDVIIDPMFDDNAFNVSIFYNIVGIDALPQQLSFVLLPTR